MIFVRTDDTDANRQPPSPNLSFYRIFIAHLWLYGTPTIVGYGNNALRFGFSLVTPQFVNVGGGAYNLSSIQGVGTDENPASDNIAVATVDEYGTAVDTYTWNDWAADTPCWVDDSYSPVEGVVVAPGQAFWTSGAAGDQSIMSSGEVGVADVTVGLRFGFTLIGNPFPISVNLQDIIAGSADGDASDNVAMATIDEYGTAVDTYTWNDWAAETPCWVNDSYEPVDGVSIAPGQGLWTSASSDAQFIRFPAPEL